MRFLETLALAIVLAGSLLAPRAFATERTGSIKGIVRNGDSHAPVPYSNVGVVEARRHTMTGSDGAFLIAGLAPGVVRLRVSNLGYRGRIVEGIVVTADSVTEVTVTLMREWPERSNLSQWLYSPSGDVARRDPFRPFTVDFPRRWFANAANFWVMHYRYVFAVVNNVSDNLRVTDKTLPNERKHSPDTVAEQLVPGTVYVDFAHFEGPARSAAYGPGREDSFEKKLASFLRNPSRKSTRELDTYRLAFVKWGSQWG